MSHPKPKPQPQPPTRCTACGGLSELKPCQACAAMEEVHGFEPRPDEVDIVHELSKDEEMMRLAGEGRLDREALDEAVAARLAGPAQVVPTLRRLLSQRAVALEAFNNEQTAGNCICQGSGKIMAPNKSPAVFISIKKNVFLL